MQQYYVAGRSDRPAVDRAWHIWPCMGEEESPLFLDALLRDYLQLVYRIYALPVRSALLYIRICALLVGEERIMERNGEEAFWLCMCFCLVCGRDGDPFYTAGAPHDEGRQRF